MQVFVVRATIPDSVTGLQEEIADSFDEWGPPEISNLQMLADQSMDAWSLPRHAMVGDVVLFQVSLKAAKHAKRIRSQLTADTEYADEIRDTLDLVDRHAGAIIAVARVSGGTFRDDGGARWGSRYYAPVTDQRYVYFPVPLNGTSRFSAWPEFTSQGPVQYRQFSSAERYRDLLETLTEEGNDDLPEWATARPVTYIGGSTAVTKSTWMDLARAAEFGFPTEASLRFLFADWLLRELSDRRVLHSEVSAVRDGKRVGSVDNVILIDGVPVPVEVKINASTEKDLLGQLSKYRTADALTINDRQLPQRNHDIVLLVDQEGAYLTTSATKGLPIPVLRRQEVDDDAVTVLRNQLAAAIGR